MSLTIKTFYIKEVAFGEKNDVNVEGTMTLNKEALQGILQEEPLIKMIDLQIITPGDHDRWTNGIMDFIPISTKALGTIGKGITHTLNGVYVMLTGVDSDGEKLTRSGITDGILSDLVCFNKAGTPGKNDFIISFDVLLAAETVHSRPAPTAAHRACDKYIQIFREKMKKFNGNKCTEKYEFNEKAYKGEKRIALIKQVPGQGAMFDTCILPLEPSGYNHGHSIIDIGNMPIILTVNEYRDGALHAM